jgi:transposase
VDHGAPGAPTGELLSSPYCEGQEQQKLKLNDYGLGVDCHSGFFQICLLVNTGKSLVIHEITVRAVWPELMNAKQTVLSVLSVQGVRAAEDDLRYTLESTGQYHKPICLAWRGRPSIINPSDTSYSRRKTDRLDARKLAHHSLTGLWRETWMPPVAIEELRALTAQRARLGSERTRLSNRINAEMLRFGHTVGQLGAITGELVRPLIEDFCRDGRVGIYGDYFSSLRIPGGVVAIIDARWKRIDEIGREIRAVETEIFAKVDRADWSVGGGEFVKGDLLRSMLITIPGVGPWTAAVWLAEVGDITRFETEKKLSAYAGLDPSLKVSAGKVTCATCRRGNMRLNGALRNAARASLVHKKPSNFVGWLRGYMGRHAKASKALGLKALARRISRAMYYVHLRCEPFDDTKYRPLLSESSYPLCDVSEMGFTKRVECALKSAGIHTSRQVVQAFYSDLARRPGCGVATVQAVATWINAVAEQSRKKTPPAPQRLPEQRSAGDPRSQAD